MFGKKKKEEPKPTLQEAISNFDKYLEDEWYKNRANWPNYIKQYETLCKKHPEQKLIYISIDFLYKYDLIRLMEWMQAFRLPVYFNNDFTEVKIPNIMLTKMKKFYEEKK